MNYKYYCAKRQEAVYQPPAFMLSDEYYHPQTYFLLQFYIKLYIIVKYYRHIKSGNKIHYSSQLAARGDRMEAGSYE